MHYITNVEYDEGYGLVLTFEDESRRRVDLTQHLDGEVFEPLRDLKLFRTACLNEDIDTVVWANGADMSPDFLYDMSVPLGGEAVSKAAEPRAPYGKTPDDSAIPEQTK